MKVQATNPTIRYILPLAACLLLLASCGGGDERAPERFTTDILLRTTPVKDQGKSSLCWAYAMLSTIETDRIEAGDSVELSVQYIARKLLEERTERAYLCGSAHSLNLRGTAMTALYALGRYGVVGWEAYHSESCRTFRTEVEKARKLAEAAINGGTGLARLRTDLARALDEDLAGAPEHVWLYGATYTPEEFGRSVCPPMSYTAYTSFTHHPFGQWFVPELRDNQERLPVLNIPLDTLVARIDRALTSGRSVCWEGDTSNDGFNRKTWVARLGARSVSQDERQQQYERLMTTDDHCMQIVGRAHSAKGEKFYILKNSWGDDGPYGGFVYMSEAYLRLSTMIVVMGR